MPHICHTFEPNRGQASISALHFSWGWIRMKAWSFKRDLRVSCPSPGCYYSLSRSSNILVMDLSLSLSLQECLGGPSAAFAGETGYLFLSQLFFFAEQEIKSSRRTETRQEQTPAPVRKGFQSETKARLLLEVTVQQMAYERDKGYESLEHFHCPLEESIC